MIINTSDVMEMIDLFESVEQDFYFSLLQSLKFKLQAFEQKRGLPLTVLWVYKFERDIFIKL